MRKDSSAKVIPGPLSSADAALAPQLGSFSQALYEQAKSAGWTVVSMKEDWKQVFAFESSAVTAINILLEPDAAE